MRRARSNCLRKMMTMVEMPRLLRAIIVGKMVAKFVVFLSD